MTKAKKGNFLRTFNEISREYGSLSRLDLVINMVLLLKQDLRVSLPNINKEELVLKYGNEASVVKFANKVFTEVVREANKELSV